MNTCIVGNVCIRTPEAFTVARVDEIVSGYKPCQLVKNDRRFRDNQSLYSSSGSDVISLRQTD
jgi:hypothetical protein